MKIVYIGSNDFLTETMTGRLEQEGHDVYLLSDKAISKKNYTLFRRRFYRIPDKKDGFKKLLSSISPQVIIFAGKYYIDSRSDEKTDEEKSEEDISLLLHSLQTASELPNVRFVLLSYTQSYENGDKRSVSGRDIHFKREEQFLTIFKKHYELNSVILRASQLYTNPVKEYVPDFLSQCFGEAFSRKNKKSRINSIYQPVHASDFADAVLRAMECGKRYSYDVCASHEISAKQLNDLICRQEHLPVHKSWDEPEYVNPADNSHVKKDLGWEDIKNPEDMFLNGEITYERSFDKQKSKRKKSSKPRTTARLLTENLLIFALFAALNFLFHSQNIFSTVDILLIYIVLISLVYNAYYSATAMILASCDYLLTNSSSIGEIRNFYLQTGNVLIIMEYAFIGLIVNYTVSSLRENLSEKNLSLDILKNDYKDLRAINEENVLIKNEYEQRILTSKSGFPKLYNLVSRLMVDEPERILTETMDIISELVLTDTVAVYWGKVNDPYFRLMNALNERSAMDGKTWNLSDTPKIYEAVKNGELYQGEIGSNEPAVVLPILCNGVSETVIVIKKLPYESETLYHINLLKTLALLLRSTIEKALNYEELSRDERYISGTNILKPQAFKRRIALAREKAQKHFAEYCVAEIIFPYGNIEDAAQNVEKMLRATDCLGTDESGGLFALLSNTSPDNLNYLQKRLEICGVKIQNSLYWEEVC